MYSWSYCNLTHLGMAIFDCFDTITSGRQPRQQEGTIRHGLNDGLTVVVRDLHLHVGSKFIVRLGFRNKLKFERVIFCDSLYCCGFILADAPRKDRLRNRP